MDHVLREEVERNIAFALKEDQAFSDLTTAACLQRKKGIATLLLKEAGVIAGLPFIPLMIEAMDPTLQVTFLSAEGSFMDKGPVAHLEGSLHSLLALERTLINFIQHTTSIATKTRAFVNAVEGRCAILDTRKTLPGHRFLQKYAVRIGGGKNHRFHLADQILIKDNHLQYLSVGEAIHLAKQIHPDKRIQVEVDNEKMFEEAVNARPDGILLDNMPPEMVKSLVKRKKKGIYLEASGGIDLTTIRSYAETGVDGISIGALTHTIQAIDMSLEMRRT
jgi:nicotinate-nucleotide pyrophosphorylase (carboxylating)